MNNALFGKKMENVRKFRDIKLVTTGKRRDQLVSEGKYHKKNVFRKTISSWTEKDKHKKNRSIYLGLSILESSKTLMYESWYDYLKPKYGDIVKLCYMDTGCFIVHIKTEDFYKDIAVVRIKKLLD